MELGIPPIVNYRRGRVAGSLASMLLEKMSKMKIGEGILMDKNISRGNLYSISKELGITITTRNNHDSLTIYRIY